MKRASGVLLHITSLPNGEGIGDLGPSAHAFVDWLAAAGQSWWQMLPCGETGFGDSPYQSPSAYAGNSLMISLTALRDWGLLEAGEVTAGFGNTAGVDFTAVRALKTARLQLACERFSERASLELQAQFAAYKAHADQFWLHDYARFHVLKQQYADAAWQEWPAALASRRDEALEAFDAGHDSALDNCKLVQFFFSSQWQALRAHAAAQGIGLLGDCPIYVAADSAEVWRNPELFDLCEDGQPRVVAGVPPDYFSATGQLWGNPLYRWARLAEDGFGWWRSRVLHASKQFDLTRIDHFRGLDAYWEIPGDAPDASSGQWQAGPGARLMNALVAVFAPEPLPLVAEDLGDLTPSVHTLRETYQLPGMRVLQFGFDGGDDNPHAPERIGEDVVCYVGTHDNDTTLGWFEALASDQQQTLLTRLGLDPERSAGTDAVVALCDMALESHAQLAVLSMQDLLRLPASARFNTPGTMGDNWLWRLTDNQLTASLGEQLGERTLAANRSASAANQHTDKLAAHQQAIRG